MSNFYHEYRADVVQSFRNYKKLADRAVEQASDVELFAFAVIRRIEFYRGDRQAHRVKPAFALDRFPDKRR